MPKPRKGEKRSKFISRCIPIVIKEGATQDQAKGKCFGLWKQSKKK